MLYLAVLVCFYAVNGHMRLIWPPPRNGADGTPGDCNLLTGPCGDSNEYRIGDPDDNDNITELEPGVNTIVIGGETFVAHENYQWRIALAKPSGNTDTDDEYDECILVDHVPQFDQTNTFPNADSIHINVTIPNVDCNKCGLQVTMLQSNGACCSRYDDCIGTVYHSCATVKINGKKSWSNRKCEQPCVWGWRDYPENYYSGAQDDSYWMLDGTDLWLDYTEAYMAPNETCCEMALGKSGCDDTENDKCKWFDSDSNDNSGKNSNNGGYSSSEKKSGEQAGIAIFVILVVAIGGTIGYTYFFKKKPLDQDNGALIMPTTTPTGQLRSNTIGSIQNNVVQDKTNYVTSGETNDEKPVPTTTGYSQPVPPPRNDQPVYQQEQQTYEPQQYQPQEYQQSDNYQPEPQQYEAPQQQQQYEEPQQDYEAPQQNYEEPQQQQYEEPQQQQYEEPQQQQYEEPQQQTYEEPDQQDYQNEPQQYEEPEVEIPEMDNYNETPQYDENQYQNNDNQPTDGYDM